MGAPLEPEGDALEVSVAQTMRPPGVIARQVAEDYAPPSQS